MKNQPIKLDKIVKINIILVIFLATFVLSGCDKKTNQKSENQTGNPTTEIRNKLNEQQEKIDELQKKIIEQQEKIDELQQSAKSQQSENSPVVAENTNIETENKCSDEIKKQENEVKSKQRTMDLNNKILSDVKSSSYIEECCKKHNNSVDCKSICEEIQNNEVKKLESIIKKQKSELEKSQQKLNSLKEGNCTE